MKQPRLEIDRRSRARPLGSFSDVRGIFRIIRPVERDAYSKSANSAGKSIGMGDALNRDARHEPQDHALTFRVNKERNDEDQGHHDPGART
jgi:hypothetical protein